MKISIKSLIVVSLVIFLLVALKVEQHRVGSLQSQVAALRKPALDAISQKRFEVQKLPMQLEFARKTFKLDVPDSADINRLSEAGYFSTIKFPTEKRRELAHIRNSQLKLKRERTRLQDD